MLAVVLQDTAEGPGENRKACGNSVALERGWRMTRGRQGERKETGITMKWQETKHNDTMWQEKLELSLYGLMFLHSKNNAAVE